MPRLRVPRADKLSGGRLAGGPAGFRGRFPAGGRFRPAEAGEGLTVNDLTGKVAMVTGAGVRVGRGIAIGLAAAGADVVVHYLRSEGPANDLADELRRLGRRVELLRADLMHEDQIREMFEQVRLRLGRLDLLVNSASAYDPTPLEELDAAAWDRDMAVNVRAPALCIRYALPLMREGSSIINITDITALRGRAQFGAYCASKAALLSLTRTAAKAFAPRGIRVNAVAPGVAMWPEGTSQERKDNILSQVPLHRPGDPQDIAQAVVFLAKADYITGQELNVDGGWSIR